MIDEDALLAAIAAESDDDTPRLVYADWLADHATTIDCPKCEGEGRVESPNPQFTRECPICRGTGAVSDGRAERAEFVRVQCELARSFPDLDSPCVCKATEDKFHCPRCMAWDESEPLRERERRLWGSWPDKDDQRTYFHNLLGGGDPPTEWVILPGSMASDAMGRTAAVVRRGFVDEVRLPLAALVGGPCPCGIRGDTAARLNLPRGAPGCVICFGTGRTAGLAAAVGRLVGVRAVYPVDVPVVDITGPTRDDEYRYGFTNLPVEIAACFGGDGILRWPNAEAASASLGRATLAFCKAAAAHQPAAASS